MYTFCNIIGVQLFNRPANGNRYRKVCSQQWPVLLMLVIISPRDIARTQQFERSERTAKLRPATAPHFIYLYL